MDYSDWNNKFMDVYGNQYVKAVAVPLPPIRASNSNIFMPDSFSSKEYDPVNFTNKNEIIYAGKQFTEWGPIFLVFIEFKQLIYKQTNCKELMINKSAFCANVSYYNLLQSEDCNYAWQTSINELNLINRSCHGGSHICVPKAPFLTSILQLEQSSERTKDIEDFSYMMPQEGEKYFDYVDYTKNVEIDNMLSKCVFDDDLYYYKRKSNCVLDSWVVPFLEILRFNPLIIGEYSYEQWKQKQVSIPSCPIKVDDFSIEGIDNINTCSSIVLEQESKSDSGCGEKIAERIKEIQGIKI
jgi:hypothetical protein